MEGRRQGVAMAGRYGGGLACVISWPLLSAEKVSRPREESARHQLHKSDPFPPRNVDPSWEMAQFVRDLQEEFCETLSNFYHTLQEPYDDTVLGPAKFRNHMIFLGFKRQHPACWGGSLAPPGGGAPLSFGCTWPRHGQKTTNRNFQSVSRHDFMWPQFRS